MIEGGDRFKILFTFVGFAGYKNVSLGKGGATLKRSLGFFGLTEAVAICTNSSSAACLASQVSHPRCLLIEPQYFSTNLKMA